MTASEARRLWFRLLDEVLDGEVVVITRRGRKIVIRREDPARGARPKLPDYAHIIRVPESDMADTWRWDWGGPEQDLELREDEEA
ncbi:MAG: type II toxin-antitoxin system prevent-host-death family antitoxin [Longimicrobiales bacterium]